MHMAYLVNIVAEQSFYLIWSFPLGYYHCVEEGAEASRQQHIRTQIIYLYQQQCRHL